MIKDWVWVDDGQKRKQAKADISRATLVSIDTEYDSLRYFRDKLCLIQLGTAERIYLFDPLDGSVDYTFLGDVFRNPEQQKVLHAGDNDIRILRRDYRFEFKNVFDTQRAAALLGSSYLSLSTVIEEYLGVALNKTKRMQRSRWENRPLTDDQIEYAVRDAAYLIVLCQKMTAEILHRGLEEKARRAFEAVASARWTEKTLDEQGHKGIKGYEELTDLQKSRLRAIYRWRFGKAKKTNTARFMILSDQDLLDIARSNARSPEGLEAQCGLSSHKAALFGPEILKVLENL